MPEEPSARAQREQGESRSERGGGAPRTNKAFVVDLGRRDYRETWELQRELVERRLQGALPDVLLFVEHPPTYTLGRNGKRAHLLTSAAELERSGASFVETDRGGDVTFHGPGQLVGYPIVDLKAHRTDVLWYVRAVEEVLMRALARFGIETERFSGRTGVWHPTGKIAAIGIRISRWITSHGFALNVSTDLRYFDQIVPCGIVGAPVASMEKVLLRSLAPTELDAVKNAVSAEWGSVFGCMMLPVSEDEVRISRRERGLPAVAAAEGLPAVAATKAGDS